MTERLPVGWQGRLLALAFLLVAVAATFALAALPLLDLYADRAASAETRRAFVVKLHAIAAELPALRQRIGELRAAAASRQLTLDGTTDAIASAGLQGHITELAGAAGITVGSTESLPAQTLSGYRRLGLRLVLSGPYDSLLKLLATIETTTPPLVVDNLQMHSFQKRPGAPAVAALDASFEVYGFRADETADIAKR